MPVLSERLSLLRALCERESLDLVLLYSTRADSRYSMWSAGIECRSSFHYRYVSPTESGFLEVSYRSEELRGRTSERVRTFADEDLARDGLTALLQSAELFGSAGRTRAQRVGVVGAAPLLDLNGLAEEFVDLSEPVQHAMMRKAPHEIRALRILAGDLQGIIEAIGSSAQPGESERAVASRLQQALLEVGDGLPFTPSVVSAERLAHATVGAGGDRVLQPGDTLLIDAGLIRAGLVSDCTRMWRVGAPQEPPPAYQGLRRALRKTIAAAGSGMTFAELGASLSAAIAAEGLNAESLERPDLGHGIGFGLHEPPFFLRPSTDALQLATGMVFTLEPEIVTSDGRVRIEDMVAVSDGGSLEILTA